jgi:hypothetical protein
VNRIGTIATAVLVAGFALAMTTFAALAASEFEGVWAAKDTSGKPFEITLSADGKATHSGEGQALSAREALKYALVHFDGPQGTWKEEGGSAVISWTSGWTTKITKEGDRYVKTAFKKGTPLDGPPTNKSDAVKK